VPVNDQSNTLALADPDAAASGSKPPIIMAANVVANFIDRSPGCKRLRATSSRDPSAGQ
jgi:hypothetical protein